jgi:hypothetical protein
MAKNPTWSRDELILALDLYLRHRERLARLMQLFDEFAHGWAGFG